MALVDENEALNAAFGHAAPEYFAWQTESTLVAERERELVRTAFLPLGRRVLDLGCGEGATLVHLGEPEGATGVDLFEAKVQFAAARLPRCRFVRASVYELPFEDQSFDHLLVRDLIHHLERPARFVEECARVLAPGGRIDVLEPSRYNPLVFMHAVCRRAERGELRSTIPFLTSLLAPHFRVVKTARSQAFPLHRVVFHPDLGRPAWADVAPVRATVDRVERWADRVLPDVMRAYIHVRATSLR
jgi:ubiquinone/menaquinone biosynthesis C-methylase UbiE